MIILLGLMIRKKNSYLLFLFHYAFLQVYQQIQEVNHHVNVTFIQTFI
jgi:hypothetical protein